MFCKECNKEFATDVSLHGHLRAHKITTEEYYHKYYPRYDLLTHKILPYKNRDYYLNSSFATRSNCLDFFKQLAPHQRLDFLCGLLKRRQIHKKLIFAPSQVELRTSVFPSLIFLDKLNVDYEEAAKLAGLPIRYNYKENRNLVFQDKTLILLQDTREQLPLKFSKHIIIPSGLSYGDYTCKNNFNNVFIERKSAIDFIGTFSKGLERFEKEIARAAELGSTIFVLCESPLNAMERFNFIDYIKRVTRVTPECIFHNVRYLLQKYSNLQFGFIDGRKRMAEVIEKIYSCESDIRNYDIQYLIDIGVL